MICAKMTDKDKDDRRWALAFRVQLWTKLNRFKKAPTSCSKSPPAVKTKPQAGKTILAQLGIFTGVFCFSGWLRRGLKPFGRPPGQATHGFCFRPDPVPVKSNN
jgi:hypothetical protein